MADVFISYKRSPTRQLLVRRLALILRANELSVWWDFGLEAGQRFEDEIKSQIEKASSVVPLWCERSVNSVWVNREATLGANKLHPARLQKVSPPEPFEFVHACDLSGWDGDPRHSNLAMLIQALRTRAGKTGECSRNMEDELSLLPTCKPLPDYDPAGNKVLHRLRRAYLDQDPAIDFEDAASIRMETPITYLTGEGSPEERFDELWNWLSGAHSDYLITDEGGNLLFDLDEFESLTTVGDLIRLLVDTSD